MFLFVRVLPLISIFEMRTLLPQSRSRSRRGRRDALMAHDRQPATPFYGLMAEFDTPQALLDAADKVARGRLHEDRRVLAVPDSRAGRGARTSSERKVAPIVLAGGITGALAGYGLEYWTQVIAYPMNIGGRPYHAWVSFIPPAFETTILFAAFSAVIGMLALNGLPQPYHPVFNAPALRAASQDKFFLAIEATDPKFDAERDAAVPGRPAAARGGGS